MKIETHIHAEATETLKDACTRALQEAASTHDVYLHFNSMVALVTRSTGHSLCNRYSQRRKPWELDRSQHDQMPVPLLTLTLEPRWGAELVDVLKEAKRIAIAMGVIVAMNFNGAKIQVEPNSDLNDLHQAYHNHGEKP